jgi:hypothetical protein
MWDNYEGMFGYRGISVRSNGRVVWLWWWLGVLVASCGQSVLPGSTAQVPTPPLLSLTLPLATPTPILRLLRTPTLRATGLVQVTRTATPLPLPVVPPACYETPAGSLWCLGLVRNELSVPIDQVIVRVYLVRADGTALDAKDASAVRVVLEPGAASPYGVLFNTVPEGTAGPVGVLISANTSNGQASHFVDVAVRDVQSDVRASGFHVSGKLINKTPTALRQLSLVVTLLDDGGRVVGFRELRWSPDQTLGPAAALPFELDAVPQGRGASRVEVSAEGRSD